MCKHNHEFFIQKKVLIKPQNIEGCTIVKYNKKILKNLLIKKKHHNLTIQSFYFIRQI